MTAAIPPQRNRCRMHVWCTATTRRHRVHTGEAFLLTTVRGVELRVALTAENDQPPVVTLEASFETSGPLMQLAELEVAEALELAEVFQRLARAARIGSETR